MRALAITLLATSAAASTAWAAATPIPTSFESRGEDRKAIETLLSTYTKAVSSKDQTLFETLLLNKSIPFSPASAAIRSQGAEQGSQNYEGFRKGVFEGPPFQQSFRDVDIRQDGPLAEVSLVFVNSAAGSSSWGWKTMQLLKVDGRWKIASEFYTGHG